MKSIKAFLDTDVILNWLCKEVTKFLVSRDRDFNIVNKIKGKLTAFTPESFLETTK